MFDLGGDRGRVVVAIALAVMAGCIAGLRRHTFDEPLERDLTAYAVVAQGMLDGRALYADMWDHKPPGVHLAYALAIALFGFGPRAIYALSVGTAVLTLLGVYFAGSAGGRGRAVGLVAAAFWAAVSGDLYLQANQPNTEVFINVCLVWAFALAVGALPGLPSQGRSLGIGLLFGLAMVFKPVAVAVTPLVGLLVFAVPVARRRIAGLRVLIMAAGCIGVVAAMLLWFALNGTFADFWEAVVTYNQAYGGSTSDNLMMALRPDLFFSAHFSGVVPLLALAACGGLLNRFRWRVDVGMLGVWALGTFVAVAMPGRFFAHYYQLWLPLTAIAAAWALAGLAPRMPGEAAPAETPAAARPSGPAVADEEGSEKSRKGKKAKKGKKGKKGKGSAGAPVAAASEPEDAPRSGAAELPEAAALPRPAPMPRWVMLRSGLLLAALVWLQWPYYDLSPEQWSVTKYRETKFYATREYGRQIGQMLTPEETFHCIGSEPGLYFYAQRSPVSGVIYTFPLKQGPLTAKLATRMLTQLQKAPPELLVVTDWFPNTHPLGAWYQTNYRAFPDNKNREGFSYYYRTGGSLEARLFGQER